MKSINIKSSVFICAYKMNRPNAAASLDPVHIGEECESISIILKGNRFHATLSIFSPKTLNCLYHNKFQAPCVISRDS